MCHYERRALAVWEVRKELSYNGAEELAQRAIAWVGRLIRSSRSGMIRKML